jgi:hypothetical protein
MRGLSGVYLRLLSAAWQKRIDKCFKLCIKLCNRTGLPGMLRQVCCCQIRLRSGFQWLRALACLE